MNRKLVMTTPLEKQKRLQIILAVIIGMTLPCYGLGMLFVSVDRRNAPTPTARPPETATETWSPLLTDTPDLVIPTRFPTFTPTLTATATLTQTNTPTPSDTPEPTATFTATSSPTSTHTPSHTPSDTPPPPATTEAPPPTTAP